MRHPDIVHNVSSASEFTRNLTAPNFSELFPEHAPDLEGTLVSTGKRVYSRHCSNCHGEPDGPDDWKKGSRQGEIVAYQEIGTDAERVTFRRFKELPDAIVESFPEDHPFHLKREEIRPGPSGDTLGYINAPIEYAFLRSPYLHNGSILTLAELINLEERRSVFYRGRNEYDPVRVGLTSPGKPSVNAFFRFDTNIRGNSNRGHEYPWPFDSPLRDESQLKALLEYLKTL